MAYKFSLIRFVPDPARGEFVNIGAIAGDEASDDWAIRWIQNYKRANALDPGGLFRAAKAFSGELDERFADLDRPTLGTEPPSVAWLSQLAAEMNNLVQFTPPAPVVADSAEAALDRVFDRLVVDPARVTYRFQKKQRAQAAARRAYDAHDVPSEARKEHVRVVSGAFSFEFDFAVHNGRAVQLVQCWSFQLPDQEALTDQVKSWAWVAAHIRKSGGRFLTDGGVEVPSDLDLAAIYIPPLGTDAIAFSEAQGVFQELEISAARFDAADDVGARAAAGLRH